VLVTSESVFPSYEATPYVAPVCFAKTSRQGALLTNAFLGYSKLHKTTQNQMVAIKK